jgi:hypothetical protein
MVVLHFLPTCPKILQHYLYPFLVNLLRYKFTKSLQVMPHNVGSMSTKFADFLKIWQILEMSKNKKVYIQSKNR